MSCTTLKPRQNCCCLTAGINLVHNQRKVSRVVVKEAFNAGWRVGDVILEVDGKQAHGKAWQRFHLTTVAIQATRYIL